MNTATYNPLFLAPEATDNTHTPAPTPKPAPAPAPATERTRKPIVQMPGIVSTELGDLAVIKKNRGEKVEYINYDGRVAQTDLGSTWEIINEEGEVIGLMEQVLEVVPAKYRPDAHRNGWEAVNYVVETADGQQVPTEDIRRRPDAVRALARFLAEKDAS